MRSAILSLCLLLTASALGAAQVWTVQVEEPTGLYRRTNEIVAIRLDMLGGKPFACTVLDAAGRELPWQVTEDQLLFPVSLIPGELPEYKIIRRETGPAPPYRNEILAREIGLHRIELGNDRFRVLIDKTTSSIVEAYSLTADPYRRLNLVETTPERAEALKGDIHSSGKPGRTPVAGVAGENTGWSSLGGVGAFTKTEWLETGPLRGRVRLTRSGETWELTWTAFSGALRWKAGKGFRFAAVSVEPYLPFNRFLGGSEYEWPTGPDKEEPPDRRIGARSWTKLPGGHAVYYRHEENYGALGLVALDPDLRWTGIGARRFLAEKGAGESQIAITFPRWKGYETVLAAREENRILRQPVLTRVLGPADEAPPVVSPAVREPAVQIDTGKELPPYAAETISLDGEWELAWSEKGEGVPQAGWRKVRVPGTVHTQWLEPAKIYTHEAEWVGGKEWWYRRSFHLPARFRGKRLRLQFEATDYFADAWFNGRRLGRHEGYIDPYEYDVSNTARVGQENDLLIRVWTPVSYYWKHRPYDVKGSYGAVDQKPDDITALGITRPVRLEASDSFIITDVSVETRLLGSDAQIEVRLETDARPGAGLRWELGLSPRNFSAPERILVRSPVAFPSTRLSIPVKNPRLWWTWDHGRPNLYTLEIRLVNESGTILDGRALAVGIREIERQGWTFYLNRKRLFVRGTNYYYHLFLSEMNRAGYEKDLRLMIQMNVNMIRLHCHFTNREFYDLADESGVLVWQDFLEAWYPHDRDFSLRAAALYDPLIRYVRNHPSVAIWATSDEEDLENYRDLTKHLAARPALLDPQRRAVVRSTGRYGDAHVYHGWYGGSIWEYAKMDEEFVSELGATALPNYETLVKFLPDHWPIQNHAEEWFFRRLQIREALRAWGSPGGKSLKEYVPQTQAYVSRLFQIALERMRRLKYRRAGGILHFHAIDIWPSVTMAAIGFDRVPTKVFYTVQRSFAPVAALFEYYRDRWRVGESFASGIWAVNDRWQALPDCTVAWQIVNEEERPVAGGEWKLILAEDSSQKVGDVRWLCDRAGSYELRAMVRDEHGRKLSENVFEFTILPARPKERPAKTVGTTEN